MRLIYDGMFDEVEVPEAGIVVTRGQPVDVPDEIGGRLLLAGVQVAEDGILTPPEHPDWRPATATVTDKKAATAATPPDGGTKEA